MNLLELNVPILEQLRIEEALLRVGEGSWCLINRGTPPAIVMGISGKPEELLHVEEVKRQNIPVIKRFSGGGTVLVDEQTLFVTFIGEELRYPEPIMRWVSDRLPKPLALWENDFIIGDRKCGGNAQYIRKGRWLHHISFLWDYSEERMRCLQLPKRRPQYRQDRNHSEFLCRLKEHFESPEAFFEQIALGDVSHRSLQELTPLLSRPHRQGTEKVSPLI